ncbi:hypothetical protein EPUS_09507 [Endocarpon pusillum Z07020]|uniref:C2H2-type domain-containing protein n=1 Tax=Endocarpon pusillum (strain Z07020 / HMAS-L-300199) TaxID=1263415 RepID=U1FWV4_ENDPU|nr:uncharacterized protein EPUS_09507 [Endocarpon pusillum Z07020]ERF69342.1 hypothetical protein EPUS_09507 [Endocarpon pusillum Z07020]
MALHHSAAGIKNVTAAPTTSSNTVVDWIETKSQVVTALPSKEIAFSSQEELFATVFYKANFALLCQICQTSNLHCHLSTSLKRDLGYVRDSMCLWGDALGNGRLEACLSPQDELHKSLISLLDRIGKTLITVIEQSISIWEVKKAKWSLVESLQELLSKATSILSVDEPSSSICESDSDSASETDDDESQDTVVADIRSLQVYSKLLMDLCPTLEQAFNTRQHGAGEKEPASSFKSFEVTESALPWVSQVYEKFRTADNGLLKRLGEANWQRCVRIRALKSDSATAQESFEEPKTIFKPSTVHTFRDSALGASTPAQSEVAGSVASHTSFMSSVEGEGGNHHAVPRTPQQISRNEPFTCPYCGTLLKTLRNRIDWKMHVFSDLQAYICTFNDCHERLKTFSTRTLWSRHELEAHFSDKSFRCRDCHESSVTFTDQESFLDHLSRVHGAEALTHVQALSMAQAAAQSVPRSFTDQTCPLCAQTDWKSQREYFTHLGKHLEQISLTALPPEEDESEDDDDSVQGDEENSTFKCICGFDNDDGYTIWDKRCDTWQHIACYYGNDSQRPEEHLCVDCSPRNLDTAGASQRQKESRRKSAPYTAPHIGADWSTFQHCLDQASREQDRIGARLEAENKWFLDESKRQQVNGQNLLNDAQQHSKNDQYNHTYGPPYSPSQELGPMQRKHREGRKGPSQDALNDEASETSKCPYCEKTFSGVVCDQKSNLKRHIGHKHHHLLDDAPNYKLPSTKEHKCPYCGTGFTGHHNVKSHLLTHSQEKPYVCSTCQSSFRRLHDLKRHTKLHTGERPHVCIRCRRKFARGDALAHHQNGPGGCAGRRSSPPVDGNSPRSDTSLLTELKSYAKQTGEHGRG